MQRSTLPLVAKILPPLFAVGVGVYVTWCQAIAFVGGTIPLFGWHLVGGFLTGVLWALFVTGLVAGAARLALRLLLAAIGRVIPLTVSTPADGNPPAPPEGAAAGYHAGFASACAVGSQLAYATDDGVRQAAGGLKLSGLSIIVEHNHRCLLLVYADVIIVAFRGTDAGELADWKTNAQTTPVPGPFGLVHSGYLAAVDLLWPRLTASLQRMRENNQSLLLTGHSMGGALAVVASAKFAADGAVPIAGLYTFGQPAVAEPAFESELAARLDGRYFRFVNSVDLVPGIFVDNAFAAGGQQLFIDRAGRIHTGDVTSQMAAAQLMTSMLEPETRRAEVGDHGIGEYLRALTSPAPVAQAGSALHQWVTAALYAVLFGAFCVLTWRANGTEAFAMGAGALFTLAILVGMFFFPQAFNDHLVHWYTRQGLAPNGRSVL